jgi:uncharacterized membrane protein
MRKKEEEIFKHLSHPTFTSFRARRTLGQRAADNLTKWAGSWAFILSLFTFLIAWMIINSYILIKYIQGNPFDPYPFILLNLVLSCLAAVQAPIILMSQNRQSQKDRIKAEYDYQVNKKAEEEIREIREMLMKKIKKFK